jgi:hypothetical protein
VPQDRHADLGFPVWLPHEGRPHTLPKEAGYQDAVGLEHAVHFEQPRAPVFDVREHRQRLDEIQVVVLKPKWRLAIVLETVQRWAGVLRQPGNAGRVDVAAPELRSPSLVQKVPENAAGPATEIEHPLALEAPPLG